MKRYLYAHEYNLTSPPPDPVKWGVYEPKCDGECNVGKNGVADWFYNVYQITEKGCNNDRPFLKHQCLPPNKRWCTFTSEDTNPDWYVDSLWQKAGTFNTSDFWPRIKCIYDMYELFDGTDVKAKEILAMLPQNEVEEALNQVCFTVSNGNCTNQSPTCSEFFKNTSQRTVCRQWLNSKPAVVRDSLLALLCAQYPNLTECKCINRAQYPAYQQLSSIPVPDGCFWVPCKNDQLSHIPSALENPKCPSSVCQIIAQNAGGQINVDDNIINCNSSSTIYNFKWLFISLAVITFIITAAIIFNSAKSRKS